MQSRRSFLKLTSLIPATLLVDPLSAFRTSPDFAPTALPLAPAPRLQSLCYTFDNFVVSPENDFAFAATKMLATHPTQTDYNPLVICGQTGLGKTHLMHAYLNEVRARSPHLRIIHEPAETFLNQCIRSIRRNEMENFRKTYVDNCDVFCLDDAQILGRGEAIQEEYLRILSHHLENGNRVIFVSDNIPSLNRGLFARIRTRLESGLTVSLHLPDRKTRLKILRFKATERKISLPTDVAEYLAALPVLSIRHLEGLLLKTHMSAQLNNVPLSIKSVHALNLV